MIFHTESASLRWKQPEGCSWRSGGRGSEPAAPPTLDGVPAVLLRQAPTPGSGIALAQTRVKPVWGKSASMFKNVCSPAVARGSPPPSVTGRVFFLAAARHEGGCFVFSRRRGRPGPRFDLTEIVLSAVEILRCNGPGPSLYRSDGKTTTVSSGVKQSREFTSKRSHRSWLPAIH